MKQQKITTHIATKRPDLPREVWVAWWWTERGWEIDWSAPDRAEVIRGARDGFGHRHRYARYITPMTSPQTRNARGK